MKMNPYDAVATDRGAGLTCPRRDCGGKFVVNLDRIKERRVQRAKPGVAPVKTIVCPYCHRVSGIP